METRRQEQVGRAASADYDRDTCQQYRKIRIAYGVPYLKRTYVWSMYFFFSNMNDALKRAHNRMSKSSKDLWVLSVKFTGNDVAHIHHLRLP